MILLQKHGRIWICLAQLYAKDITLDDKQELGEALRREIQEAFRTDEIRRTPPTPQDEMWAGMSYFHETIWKGVPKTFRQIDTALKNIGYVCLNIFTCLIWIILDTCVFLFG